MQGLRPFIGRSEATLKAANRWMDASLWSLIAPAILFSQACSLMKRGREGFLGSWGGLDLDPV